MITALGGGVGASKFLRGLREAIGDEPLTVVVNTADDITLHGLRISPDIDTVIYWLSGVVDRKRGWGQEGDTFDFLSAFERFEVETWFKLGDLDLATHIYRTHLRQEGLPHTEITSRIARAFGIKNTSILPMCDEDVETWIETEKGLMHFQEYFVRERMKPAVKGVRFKGVEKARPAPGVIEAIERSRVVIVCPSNPIISIGPILEVRGIRDALGRNKHKVAAVSPLVGGKPIKGPADRLMRGLGLEVSSTQIAKLYKDFLHTIVIDNDDAAQAEPISSLGIETVVADTIMTDDRKAEELAQKVLGVFV
ncbi:MAG: 2-phospho-L-lactate transferase [Candidatus Dadabacteria bacterium]|nr:2-phospho-L-lactate transferase [Candidatus Dadabacteria bacterium]